MVDYLTSLVEFVGEAEFWAPLNAFTQLMKVTELRLSPRNTSDESNTVARLLFELARDNFFLLRVTELKLTEIGTGLIWAAQSNNHTVSFNLARAFMEHTASLAFQLKHLGRACTDLPQQGALDGLQRVAATNGQTLRRLYYGGGPKSEIKQFHVHDFLEELQRHIPDQREI
jgi:hypothetical protein